MALNAIGFAMIGLVYGLSHWILYTSGIRANPAWWSKKCKPDELVPEQTIGAMGSLAAAIGLLFLAIWMVIVSPFSLSFGSAFAGWDQILAIAGGLFGFLFLGTFFAATRGYDWRPIGDAAMFGAAVDFLVLCPVAVSASLVAAFPWEFTLGLYVWGLLAATWGLVIHGKCSAKILQANLVASLLVALYYMVFGSGIASRPKEIATDVQGWLTADGWFVLFLVIGILAFLGMIYTYMKGPEKQLIW